MPDASSAPPPPPAALLEAMKQRRLAPHEAARFAAGVLATEPHSALRDAALEFLRGAGRLDPHYSQAVEAAFSEENYTAFCRQGGAPEAPPPPANWNEWEEQGWWRVAEDWPIAGLLFELENADEVVNRRLRRLRSPLTPGAQTLQYFLLHRLRHATTTSLERVSAIGELISATAGAPGLEPLYDRALLVFCRHWRLLEMGELTALAAEVYLDLCDLAGAFTPGQGFEPPPLLEGLDIEHLEKRWRQGPDRWALLGRMIDCRAGGGSQ